MTYIILVYYSFTKDITYLSFAAIVRCSIPVEKPPAFCSELLPNFVGVSKWKYSIRIRQSCLRTPARRALRCWTHCRDWNLIPIHAEKIQKNTGAPIKVIPKPKVNVSWLSSRQVIDLLHKNKYKWNILNIYQSYDIIESIYQVYTWYISCINLSYDVLKFIPDKHLLKTFCNILVPVTLRYGHRIYLE